MCTTLWTENSSNIYYVFFPCVVRVYWNSISARVPWKIVLDTVVPVTIVAIVTIVTIVAIVYLPSVADTHDCYPR